jgi:hypothetical protein
VLTYSSSHRVGGLISLRLTRVKTPRGSVSYRDQPADRGSDKQYLIDDVRFDSSTFNLLLASRRRKTPSCIVIAICL